MPTTELAADRRLKPWRPLTAARWRRRAVVALVVVVVLLPVLWGGWVHFGPRLVIRRMAAKYAQARSLQVTASLREDLGLAATGEAPVRYGRVSRFTLGYQTPNLYYCHTGAGPGAAHLVMDGRFAYVQVDRLNVVYYCAAPAALPRIWPAPVGPPAAGAGGLADPLALVTGAASPQSVTSARFGVDASEIWLSRLAGPSHAWRVSVKQAGREGTCVLWIDRSTGLLRQAALETAHLGRLVVYEGTALGASLPPAAFRYQSPPGFQLVPVADLEEAAAAIRERLKADLETMSGTVYEE